jgi:hypothetical protein
MHNPPLRQCCTAPKHPHVVCTPYNSMTKTRLWLHNAHLRTLAPQMGVANTYVALCGR